MTIKPAKVKGKIVGFDVPVQGRMIVPVRLSSNGLITAEKVEEKQEGVPGLRLSGLRAKGGTGLALGTEDFVEVTSLRGQPFPLVKFRLSIADFDPAKWEKNAGKFPFHFLAFSMPNADSFHQRGWLMATPKADPFPLLLDAHVGTPEICANWSGDWNEASRHWSYAPPIGCYPIPVIGLWAPSEKLYVAYDFLGSRLGDQSERYIASAYCWKEGADSQFITLVYPYQGRGFQTLTYPEKGSVVVGRFRLMYSTNMPSTDDPNTFLQEYYFKTYADKLPRVPPMNDMGWMPGGTRLKELNKAPRGGIVHRSVKGGTFEEPGTVEIGGWTWHRESAVFAAYRRQDEKMIAKLKEDIAYLLTKAERVTIDGDECIFWSKPIEGKWRDKWGGEPVKTLHNANAWTAGIVLVDFYRHDKTNEYLPLIDGIYNWTKHFVWTRNEFADVPSSPFAIGGTLSAAFLLDYYFAFKNDPERAGRAKDAVELARKIAYRYMPAWVCDNDRDDDLDSAFLWEPNSGRDWTGTACANEVHWNLDTLTQVYVNCGDPIMNYYLRGSLERWYLLYKDLTFDSLADYPHDALSEWLGFFDGTMAGRGGRAGFGTGDMLPMHYPVGDSILRVTCGEKAAFACCKGGLHSNIENYRYSPDVNFEFTVRSSKPQPFDVSVSFPFADITEKPVSLTRGGATSALSDERVGRSPDAPSGIYLRGIQNGDIITVGTVVKDAPPLRLDNDWTARSSAEPTLTDGPFQMHKLPLDTPLPNDWDDVNSYAGLWPGRHTAWSAPFLISSDAATSALGGSASGGGAPLASDKACTVDLGGKEAVATFIFFSPKSEKGSVQVTPEGRTAQSISPSECALAWRSWPPCFKQKVLMAKVAAGEASKVTVSPTDAYLLAATSLCDASQEKRIAEVFDRGKAEFKVLLAEEQKMREMAELVAKVPAGRVAILPVKSPGGPVFKAMQKSSLLKRCRQLKPEELLDAHLFTAQSLPILLNLSGEEYAGTIKKEGDGAEAILSYLRSGGFIIMLTSQPLPFYYDGLGTQHTPRPLTPRMGMPISLAFEKPPEGATLKIILNPEQKIITGIPGEMPFFTEHDLRLRSIQRDRVSPDARYTPIFTVMGSDGKNHGDAAAYAEFTGGEFKGARLLYVWSRFLLDKELGPGIIEQMIKYIVAQGQK